MNQIQTEEILNRLKKIVKDYPQFNLKSKFKKLDKYINKYITKNLYLNDLLNRCKIEKEKLVNTNNKLESKKKEILNKIGR